MARKKFSQNRKKNRSSSNIIGVYIGVVDVNNSGNGYFICPELQKDAFISKPKLNTAQNKDEVEVEIFTQKSKGQLSGRVRKILKRHKSIFSGTILRIIQEKAYASLSDKSASKEVIIDVSREQKLKVGDKIVIEIEKWCNDDKPNEGRFVDILGTHGEHHAEIKSILVENGLPYSFPREVEQFAEQLDVSISEKEIRKRQDLRKILTFTIDPKDAKDFDDALSFEALPNGNFKIGIHIADVSHYVRPNTVLEEEAFDRATSIYLVDRVVPMLPEMLSNGVCSLRPREEKYTFSAIFEITSEAQILNRWFGKTIICSDYRFSYEEAQHFIETEKTDIPSDVALDGKSYTAEFDVLAAVLKLNTIAEKMRQRRMNKGAFSFNSLEVKFMLDKDCEPTGVYIKEAKEANFLVEEFMLLTNRSVAEFIGKEKKKVCVYRIHDEPDMQKLQALGVIASTLGHKLNLKEKSQIPRALNKLLDEVKGKKEQNLLDTLAIRSMSKAAYSIHNIGHYGLAFEYYTHFTSPIRRYPDIMVHRILQDCLMEKQSENHQTESLENKCKHCSQMEGISVNAERDSIKYMQVRFLEINQRASYEGVISGLTERGMYVEISENKCEGMIYLKDIEGDYYYLEPENYRIVGKRRKKSYQLGDSVKVSVKSLDLEKRHINLKLLG